VPFEKACDLVAKRRVVMKKGFAFLHFEDLVSIICREFKDTLSEGASPAPNRGIHLLEQSLSSLLSFSLRIIP
jgi:DNA primase large subunit